MVITSNDLNAIRKEFAQNYRDAEEAGEAVTFSCFCGSATEQTDKAPPELAEATRR